VGFPRHRESDMVATFTFNALFLKTYLVESRINDPPVGIAVSQSAGRRFESYCAHQ
jgi:hypothetical protein